MASFLRDTEGLREASIVPQTEKLDVSFCMLL